MLNKLNEDKIIALKAKDKAQLSIIRQLISKVQNLEIKLLRAATDQEIQAELQSYKKQTVEEKAAFIKTGNVERVAILEKEIAYVQSLLPKQMTLDEVRKAIEDVIALLKINKSAVNQGSIMKQLMPMIAGKADNKLVSQLVATYL